MCAADATPPQSGRQVMPTRNNPLFLLFLYGPPEHAGTVTIRAPRSLWQTGNLTLRHGRDTMSQGQAKGSSLIVCLVTVSAEDIVLHCRRTSMSKL